MYSLHLLYLHLRSKNIFHLNTTATKSLFKESFKSTLKIASPGRVNLIGEHTDYNQGFALPTAIDRYIHFEFCKNKHDDICHVYSKTYDELLTFNLQNLTKVAPSWKNYILGVINEIQKMGKTLGGFDCTVESDLPIGAGISSSAALECGLATGLNELFSLGLSEEEIVRLSQKAENDFVGSQCGIMDQYASVMSKKGYLILLDCQSVNGLFIPAQFKSCQLVLLNTNVTHNLAESEYNARRKECEVATKELTKFVSHTTSLRDFSLETIEQHKNKLSPVQYKRVRYVLKENQRVLEACEAIESGDLINFGELMYASHKGLKEEYEVSCEELDFLVDFSRDKPYVYGARMMGGGFGGCTINLVEKDYIEAYIQAVSAAYKDKFHITLDAITVNPGEGTKITYAR